VTDIRTTRLYEGGDYPEKLLMYDRKNENAWYLSTAYIDLSDHAPTGPDLPQSDDVDRP